MPVIKTKIVDLAEIFKKNLHPTGRYTAWRIFSIFFAGLLMMSIFLTIYFIYNNVYNTLSNSNTIVILSSNVDNDVIDAAAYEKAKALIDKKEKVVDFPNNIRNIFSYGKKITIPTSTPSNSKK